MPCVTHTTNHTPQWRRVHATHGFKGTDAAGTRLLKNCDSLEFVLNAAAILLRCNSKLLPEDIGQVCLAGETTP
jgi:hypothetical protein